MATDDMEFPEDFDLFPTTPTGDDYVMLNKYKATLSQLASYLTPGGGQTLVEWNGTDVAQFTTSGNIGTPTGAAISYLAQPTRGADAIRMTLGNGTGANEGKVYWFATTADFQSMRVRFNVSIDATNPIQAAEGIAGGVVIAGSQATGNSVAILVGIDDAGEGTLLVTLNSAYGTNDATPILATLTAANYGAYSWDVDVTLTGRLTDTGTYTPNGAPAFAGPISVSGFGGVLPFGALLSAASTDWNVAVGALDTDRIGVVSLTTTGVTATTGVLISDLTVESA